jgi:hypothetical protein
MKNLFFVNLAMFVIFAWSCKEMPKSQILIKHLDDKEFEPQESIVDSFLYGIQNNRQDIINKYFNGSLDIKRFEKIKFKRYYYSKGEFIKNDGNLTYQKGDVWLTVEIINLENDSARYYYNLRKFGSKWIIIDYSNEFEDQMEIDIQKTIQNLRTNPDSLEHAKH